jgi:ubiquinone/menaquinone biosynthesis C-methylase UbiE
MNEAHEELCSSDEWGAYLATEVVPRAIGAADLGDHLLEIGPGFGMATDVLRGQVERITAVDASDDYVAKLAERLEGTNVHVEVGDATGMRYDDATFTSAASFTMLHHIATRSSQDALFAEVARVLRPGGTFVGADSLDGEGFRAFHEGDVCNPVDPQELPMRLKAAGFSDVRVTAEWAFPDGEDEASGTVFFVARKAPT